MVNYFVNYLFRVPLSRAYAKISAKVHFFSDICKFFLRKKTHFPKMQYNPNEKRFCPAMVASRLDPSSSTYAADVARVQKTCSS